MANKIQLRRDTAANWTRANPILDDGEPGLDTTNNKIKYGDGVTRWNSLAYASAAVGTEPTRLKNGANTATLNAQGVVELPGTASSTIGEQSSVLTMYSDGEAVVRNGNSFVGVADGAYVLSPRGQVSLGANVEAPGLNPAHFHIAKNTNAFGSDFDLFLGDDTNYVKLPSNTNAVEINANTKNWKYDDLGNLTAPRDAVITSSLDFLDTSVIISNISSASPAILTTESDSSWLREEIARYETSRVKLQINTGGFSELNNLYCYLLWSYDDNFEMYYDAEFTQPVDTTAMGTYGSYNNRPISNMGVTAVTADPFSPGSLEFGNNGRMLTIKDASFDTAGEFTLECWFNRVDGSYGDTVFAIGTGAPTSSGGELSLYSLNFDNAGKFYPKLQGSAQAVNLSVNNGVWVHAAIVRQEVSSGVFHSALFVNGEKISINQSSAGQCGETITIGRGYLNASNYFNGNITGIRYSNMVRYDTTQNTYTVPTQQFVDDANTLLLINCENPYNPWVDTSSSPKTVIPYMVEWGTSTTSYYNTNGISSPETKVDISMAAYLQSIGWMGTSDRIINITSNWEDNIQAVEQPNSGDTRFDRYFTLWGTSGPFPNGESYRFERRSVGAPLWKTPTPWDTNIYSMDFNGGYIYVPPSTDFVIGTQDFSIEMWVYQRSYNNYPRVFDFGRYNSTPALGEQLGLSTEGNDTYAWIAGTNYSFGSGPIPLNIWRHYAICRVAGQFSLYTDGQPYIQWTPSEPVNIQNVSELTIGLQNDGNSAFNGIIRDFKFNVGSSAYNGSFPKPTDVQGRDNGSSKLALINWGAGNVLVDNSMSYYTNGSAIARLIVKTGDISIGTQIPDVNGDAGDLYLFAGAANWKLSEKKILNLPNGGQISEEVANTIYNDDGFLIGTGMLDSFGSVGDPAATINNNGSFTNSGWGYVKFSYDVLYTNLANHLGEDISGVYPVRWGTGSTHPTGYVLIQFAGNGVDFQMCPVQDPWDGQNTPVSGTWFFDASFGGTTVALANSTTITASDPTKKIRFDLNGKVVLPDYSVVQGAAQKTIRYTQTDIDNGSITLDGVASVIVVMPYNGNNAGEIWINLPTTGIPLGTRITIINFQNDYNINVSLFEGPGPNTTIMTWENKDYVLIEIPGQGKYWWETNAYSW